MAKVIIGCPLFRRAWILDAWLEHIENQTFPLEDIGFLFELGEDDEESHDKLWVWHSQHPEVKVFDGVIRGNIRHTAHQEGRRGWKSSSYWKMVEMRNALLTRVREYKPERYFSLDSDILLENPKTIENLYELTKTYDAVGTLSYMTPNDTRFPSTMSWRDKAGAAATRKEKGYPIGEVFETDIIMASKMMNQKTYQESYYQWHKQGEDLGWSAMCAEKGLKLALASNIYTAHIMHQYMLEPYLTNGDPRSTNTLD